MELFLSKLINCSSSGISLTFEKYSLWKLAISERVSEIYDFCMNIFIIIYAKSIKGFSSNGKLCKRHANFMTWFSRLKKETSKVVSYWNENFVTAQYLPVMRLQLIRIS